MAEGSAKKLIQLGFQVVKLAVMVQVKPLGCLCLAPAKLAACRPGGSGG